MKKPSLQLPRLKTILPFAAYFILVALLMPKAKKFDLEYRSGSPWKYDSLVSEFDFPVYKTDDQMARELAEAELRAIPYFRYSESVGSSKLQLAETLPLGGADSLRTTLVGALRRVYRQGVIPDDFSKADRRLALSENLIYIQRGKRAGKYPRSDVYRLGEARAQVLAELGRAFPAANIDSLATATGLLDLVEPNLLFDRQMTELVHSDEQHDISPTQGFVPAGSLIVSKGEIVTAEIAQMLDSYRREYDATMGSDVPSFWLYLSTLLIALILTILLYWAIRFADEGLLRRLGELYYIVFVAMCCVALVLLLDRFGVLDWTYLVPFTLFALYLVAFFPQRTVALLYTVILLPLGVFLPQGVLLYLLYLLAGYVTIQLYARFNRGLRQFVTALVVFLIVAGGFLILRLSGVLPGLIGRNLTFIFVGSLLTVALYQLSFLFERAFGLLSTAKLDELTDTNNKLLREMELKAPGTFQHSLQVMSMADSAARAIGANVYLVRAAAMYHDIGKMNNPQCFIENESLVAEGDQKASYHTGLSPLQSAADITRHVTDGVEMARKERLPEAVIRFIESHHGDNCVRSFYNQYLNAGGDPAQESAFRYHGTKPRTREQVILMLCDSIEAASRTLKEHTPQAFSEFVERIVGDKIREDQLSEADITIRELNTVKEVLKGYLAQIYHERVDYPKRNNPDSK